MNIFIYGEYFKNTFNIFLDALKFFEYTLNIFYKKLSRVLYRFRNTNKVQQLYNVLEKERRQANMCFDAKQIWEREREGEGERERGREREMALPPS